MRHNQELLHSRTGFVSSLQLACCTQTRVLKGFEHVREHESLAGEPQVVMECGELSCPITASHAELVKLGEKMPEVDKKDKLERLKSEGVAFGPIMRSTLLTWAVTAEEDDMGKVADMLSPRASGSFDPLNPTLGTAQLSDIETAALFLKCFVHDKLLIIMAEGEEQFEKVFTLCSKMKDMVGNLVDVDPIVDSSCQQAVEVCTYFLAIKACTLDSPEVQQIQKNINDAKTGTLAM
eukprot:996385-Amphidinium_carterae.1